MSNIFFEQESQVIEDFIKNNTIPSLEELNKKNRGFLEQHKKFYSEWNNSITNEKSFQKIFENTAALHRKIENSLQSYSDFIGEESAFVIFKTLQESVQGVINNLDKELILDQEQFHFDPIEGDSFNTRIKKKFKSFNYSVGNFFYKTFRDKNKIYKWKRTVPLKNLVSHYLLIEYLNQVLVHFEEYIEDSGKKIIELLNVQKTSDTLLIDSHLPFLHKENKETADEALNKFYDIIEDQISNLDNSFLDLTSKIISSLHSEIQKLHHDFERIGTLELPKRKYNQDRLQKEIDSSSRKNIKSKEHYHSYLSAVVDRKEFYEDLLWFSCLLISNSSNIIKYSNKFLSDKIQPILKEISDQINNSLTGLDSDSKNLENYLENEKEKIRLKFDQNLIPKLISQVSINEVSKVLADYSAILETNINEFDKEYTFVKPGQLLYRVKKDQLKQFSPKEIISPIVLKKIAFAIKKIDADFTNKISKLNTTIISLARVVEYNLDSAKAKLKEEADPSEAIKIAKEGLLRTLNKSEDYETELNKSLEEVHSLLKNEITSLLDDLISLSNIDRLITIKIQVTKEKALQEVKENIQINYEKTKTALNKFNGWAIDLFTQSKEKILGISSRVGLSDSQVELSEAMADYLVRISESLEKLPYVYQRLFSSDQLKDERIFVGREEEAAKLEKAIRYWINNQISSVMLIGEKGSGTSSMINIVLKKFNLTTNIYRKEFSGTIYTEEELLKSFENILHIDNLQSINQLIEHINSFDERKIIVIENVEDFFLKIVDGFEALTKLLEVITSTNHKVLWITTCNIHTWEFLKRVIHVNDYFIFNIRMSDLNTKIIKDIILNRHSMSGYDLIFKPTEDIKKQKSYIKANESQKEEILQEEYFERMGKLSSNNIAVALFLWLRSIENSTDEKIEVSLDIELDFSFLKALSDKKLFSLMAIILHDGLTVEEHSLIFNTSHKSSQLLFATLSDDGIIFCKDSIYRINFQLYKPIINLLKDKNILH